MTHGPAGIAVLAGALASFAALGLADPLPPSADLRPTFRDLGLSPKSQGKRGCCSLFALCGVLEFEFALQEGAQPERLSQEYLNWASHDSNGRRTDGSFFSDGLRGLRMFGICSEALMPYAEDYDADAQPSDSARENASTRKDISAIWTKSWDVKTGMTPAMLQQMKAQIAGGHPVAIWMRWPKKARYDDAHVLTVPEPEDVFDGHSVVLVGYRDDPSLPGGGAFVFRNSSGPGWREDGHAYLPYAYVAAYGNDALGMRIGGGEPLIFNTPGPGAKQFEDLKVSARHGCSPSVQVMTPFGAPLWSGGQQLFVGAGQDASLTFALPRVAGGNYEVGLWATRAPDFAVIKIALDGQPVGGHVDLYAPEVSPTGKIALGVVEVATGEHELEVRVVGRNEASSASHLGLDCVELSPR